MDRDAEFYTVPEIARKLRIARSRAYAMVANGTIPALKIGHSVRVRGKELDRWLEGQRYLNVVQNRPSSRR